MKKILVFLCAMLLVFAITGMTRADPILFEDFDTITPDDWHGWHADNGIWDIGEPTSGPGSAYSPSNCAATVLDGNYLNDVRSSLISPQILLPGVATNEEILLRFRQYFNYHGSDRGGVQIQAYEDGAWSTWINLKTVTKYVVGWHHARVDLTEYADKLVRIAFYHYDDGGGSPYVAPGWYVDDVEVLKQTIPIYTLPYLENFDSGWDDWFSNDGIWDLGEPMDVPGGAYSPPNCVATVLDGNYPSWPISRLISPQIQLPDAVCIEQILLRFRQYFNYHGSDRGEVQIQAYANGAWSAWDIRTVVTGNVDDWFHRQIDLTEYAGKLVRIAFYHYDDGGGSPYVAPGWYIDDVEIIDAICEGNFDGDLDVDGSDLAIFAADFGRTDCCDPGAEPCEADFDEDCDVDGSDLALFASDFGRTDCPFCP